MSILAAVLASLQTFLKFGENATLHGAAADWFAAIRRDIEETLRCLRNRAASRRLVWTPSDRR